jgi:hypothetical protein
MTKEMALRLAYIFKHDFKRARYQSACMYNLFANPHVKTKEEGRYERKAILFDVTKSLYLECRTVLELKHNDPLPVLNSLNSY